MRFLRPLALTTLWLLLVASVPSASEAYTAEFKLFYSYQNTQEFRQAGQGTVSTPIYGGDVRWYVSGPWGVHLRYATGNQCCWTGILTTTAASEKRYFGDLFYDFWAGRSLDFLHGRPASLRLSAGYGHNETDITAPTTITTTNSGFRVGTDFVLPLSDTFAFNGGISWSPSDSVSTTNSLGTFTATSSGLSYTASIQWTSPSGPLIEGGYQWSNSNTGAFGGLATCPCSNNLSGPFFAVGYRLP